MWMGLLGTWYSGGFGSTPLPFGLNDLIEVFSNLTEPISLWFLTLRRNGGGRGRVGFWGFQAKRVECAEWCPFQKESMNGIEVPQHHQALLWRAVAPGGKPLCFHAQASTRSAAGSGGWGRGQDNMQQESDFKNKRKGKCWREMSDFHELNCLVLPVYCSFKTVTVSWWAMAWQEPTVISSMCHYMLSRDRPCSSMHWPNTVGLTTCSKEVVWWLWKEVKRKTHMHKGRPVTMALPLLQTVGRIVALCMVSCSATRSAAQWNNLESFTNCEGCDPYHHKVVLPSKPARPRQTVSFLSLAMTSDPSWLSKGFPTRKPMQ